MKRAFNRIPRRWKLWLPPLVGIPLMLALGALGGRTARFLLFTHHGFWFVAAILLIHPVFELLWPSAAHGDRRPVRSTAGELKHPLQVEPLPGSEAAAERLARLQQEKEVVDREIEKLTARHKRRAR